MINQTLFIPRYYGATLFKEIPGGGLEYVEGPMLLRDFHVGGLTMVGSRHTRTFGNDYWLTSNIVSITKISESTGKISLIYYQTRNSAYVLQVDSRSIRYRDDLQELVDVTQTGDIEDVSWLLIAIAFKGTADEEYKETLGGEA